MKQEFFPHVSNSDVTHRLRRHHVSLQCVLGQHECTIRYISGILAIPQLRFVASFVKNAEVNQSPRIVVTLQPSETLFAVLDPSISNEQRRNLMTNFETSASKICPLNC